MNTRGLSIILLVVIISVAFGIQQFVAGDHTVRVDASLLLHGRNSGPTMDIVAWKGKESDGRTHGTVAGDYHRVG